MINKLSERFFDEKLSIGDWLVLLTALVLLVTLYNRYWQSDSSRNQAVIMVSGQFWSNIDLHENQTIEVPGKIGISIVNISNGKIHFSTSPCTTKQCIHQGWLHQGGEFAACLPNEVSIQIAGPDPRFDSINF
ncbi:MAG: NusG domain II-containing protein [Gammaproteobacteria bacterium]|nr:NusG domain II-containing protein [Gammaproteobacteria bacterium]